MTSSRENSGYKRLRILFWCAAIVLGALDAWAMRNTMNPDGVSYLDIGDAYWRGDWHMAINPYWSPLYSWLVGFAFKVLKPSAYWEYPVVHLVNFAIYLAALGSFEFFLRAFIAHDRRSGGGPAQEELATLPEWAWWTLGYSLFISTSVVMIGLGFVTPDMCVAAFVYLASGLLLRVRSGTATPRTFVLLGAVLGFAYLAKAVMFPLAFVFLAVTLFSLGRVRKAVPRVFVSTLIFLAIASPWIVTLSRVSGRPTFGAAGAVNYEIAVNRVDLFIPDSKTLHPVRKIFERPPTYEFAEPIGGTYPLWYDPSYWHAGVEPRVDVKQQARGVVRSLLVYSALFFSPFIQLNITAGLLSLMLFEIASPPSLSWKRAARNWPLLALALSGLGLYSLVAPEYRYLGAFVCLLWIVAFSGVRRPATQGSRILVAGVVVAIAATTGILLVRSTLRHLGDPRITHPGYWEAASALNENGIRPGDKIAVIAKEPWERETFVARLARIQVIAEVSEPDRFWAASPFTQSQVLEALAKTGAKAALTLGKPAQSPSEARWERLGSSDYYFCSLSGASGKPF